MPREKTPPPPSEYVQYGCKIITTRRFAICTKLWLYCLLKAAYPRRHKMSKWQYRDYKYLRNQYKKSFFGLCYYSNSRKYGYDN